MTEARPREHGHSFDRARGDLWDCRVCGGAEGALPTECPQRRMSSGELQRVYAGVLDFRDGAWRVLRRRGLVIRIDPLRPLPGVPLDAVDPWPRTPGQVPLLGVEV